MTKSTYLRHSESELLGFAAKALRVAEGLGSDAASATAHEHGGITVQARSGEAETITGDQAQGLNVTVYRGTRRGSASTGELTGSAIEAAVRHANDLAHFTGDDPSAGLADPRDLASAPAVIDLFRPSSMDADTLAELACRVEAGALESPGNIGIISAGASSHDSHHALATSEGFAGAYSSSNHAAWCAATASIGCDMQGDNWQESERDPTALRHMEAIGQKAAIRAAARIGAQTITTRSAPVLFDASVASSLLETLFGALSGSAQYQQASFLQDVLGQQVLASHVTLAEDPFLPLGMASRPFDSEGVAGIARDVICAGVANGYFLSAYSARKLDRRSTGNASGPYNLTLSSTETEATDDRDGMLGKLGTGLYLTGLTGQGVNMVSGEYSRAGHGFWVENGEIAHPVHQFTVAGNLKDMFRAIRAVGADVRRRGAMRTGSLLLDAMRIAGQ